MQAMAQQSLLHFSGSSDHMDTVSLSAAGGLAKEGIACGPVSTIKVTRRYKSIYSGFVPQYHKVLLITSTLVERDIFTEGMHFFYYSSFFIECPLCPIPCFLPHP